MVESGATKHTTYKQYLVKHYTKYGSNDNTTPTVNMDGKVENNDTCVVNSSSYEHITYEHEMLKNRTTDALETPLMIPNGNIIPIEGKGGYMLQNGIKI